MKNYRQEDKYRRAMFHIDGENILVYIKAMFSGRETDTFTQTSVEIVNVNENS